MRATKAAQLAASILKNILDKAYHLLCLDQSSGDGQKLPISTKYENNPLNGTSFG